MMKTMILLLLALVACVSASHHHHHPYVVAVAPRPYFGHGVFGQKVEGADAVKPVASGYGYGYGHHHGYFDTPVYTLEDGEKGHHYHGYAAPKVNVDGVVPIGARPFDGYGLFNKNRAEVEEKQEAALEKYRAAAQSAYDTAHHYNFPYGHGGYGLGFPFGFHFPGHH